MPIFAVCSLDTREGETTISEAATGIKERLAGSRTMMTPVGFGQLIADEINEWVKVARV
jgi:hypothetical protein